MKANALALFDVRSVVHRVAETPTRSKEPLETRG
jgi:hypothetical protein